jgi:hypothetical protein
MNGAIHGRERERVNAGERKRGEREESERERKRDRERLARGGEEHALTSSAQDTTKMYAWNG